jgi:hypothetical protein
LAGAGQLPTVRALCPRADCAPTPAKYSPEPGSIDEDPALVQDAVQEKRGIRLDALQARDVDLAIGSALQSRRQPVRVHGAIAVRRHEQVEVRAPILVAPGYGAVENGKLDTTLGSQRSTKLRQQAPVISQILPLAGGQPEPAGSGAMTTQRPLRGGTAQGALLGTEVSCKLLHRAHAGMVQARVSVMGVNAGTVTFREGLPGTAGSTSPSSAAVSMSWLEARA